MGIVKTSQLMANNAHRNCVGFGNPNSRLWKPLKIGNQVATQRVVLAPLTRYRSPLHVPQAELMGEYYEQRSHGGLLISEATFIAKEAGGYPHAPGIYTEEQVREWSKITERAKRKGSIFYCQLWALGRANRGAEPDVKVVSCSPLPLPNGPVPEEMSKEDIQRYLQHYVHASKCAIKAGFDGVEVHGAHGYLIDQFLQASSNKRTDEYGGSLENRARFLFQVLQVVSDAIGQERTAIRVSPFSPFQDMGHEPDVYQTWGYVFEQIKQRFPKLAYVSVTDPRLGPDQNGKSDSNVYSCDPFRAILRGVKEPLSKFEKDADMVFPDPTPEHPTCFVAAGGYAASDAEPCCDRTGDLIGFGRIYISNPDLPLRIKQGLELNPYNRSTFYTPGPVGYTDYPFADEQTKKYEPEQSPKL
ncbi:hypothetical protein EDD86DRAFT_236303 [Gorgonomyces haynaldii]|nr:hypothetical protein EDD86DRAFT_236303 [Gorgonomyces haynaldii]